MNLRVSRDSRWKARLLPELIRIIGPHFARAGGGSHRGANSRKAARGAGTAVARRFHAGDNDCSRTPSEAARRWQLPHQTAAILRTGGRRHRPRSAEPAKKPPTPLMNGCSALRNTPHLASKLAPVHGWEEPKQAIHAISTPPRDDSNLCVQEAWGTRTGTQGATHDDQAAASGNLRFATGLFSADLLTAACATPDLPPSLPLPPSLAPPPLAPSPPPPPSFTS
eukprot:gene24309-biopygen23885